jgi:glycine/D-amino acid oxidase-like deaminating enzyme
MVAHDCLVIGGGIVGCGVAWRLAQAGHSVVLLEASAIASGASGGPGKRGVRANRRDERELPLARRANHLWPRLADELDADTGYEHIGHLQLTERTDHALGQRAEQQTSAGIRSKVVQGDELRELEPGVSDTVVAALWCPDDGVADHTATTLATAAAAQRAGAEIREHTTVERLDGPAIITSSEERIEARSIVIAAGTATDALVGPLSTFPVYPQVVLTTQFKERPVRHLIGHEERPLAMKALPDGTVMITGGRLGIDGDVRSEEVAANLADAAAVFLQLEGTGVLRAVADRAESISPDMVPIIDRASADALVLYATGWSGHGWAIAPAVSELLVSWITTGERPELLQPFAADRF